MNKVVFIFSVSFSNDYQNYKKKNYIEWDYRTSFTRK